MADVTLDVCGEVCPLPVMKTDEALTKMKSGETLEVIVDYPPSKENVRRLVTHKGHEVRDITEDGEIVRLLVKKA
ncbi:MAG: sulfurtransferase TusA family protein [Deltaproteobacteria bacterium]|nr:sulfurtransferase TusA family protein [Deltaproteobacteria bacterium]